MGNRAVTRSTVEALDLLEDALSSIDHQQRAGLSHGQRLDLMRRARRVAERAGALAAMLTGEAERADSARVVAGTGLTSLLAAEEHTDTRQATGDVNQARDLARHPRVAEAALDGEVSVAHAQGIAKGMRQLPRGLDRSAREAYATTGPRTPRRSSAAPTRWSPSSASAPPNGTRVPVRCRGWSSRSTKPT